MKEIKTEEVSQNKGILLGTVENHSCDPQQDCSECHGNGNCVKCHGKGSNTCDKCHGTGTCTKCHGSGEIRCRACGGSGYVTDNYNKRRNVCTRCNGSGRVACPDCGANVIGKGGGARMAMKAAGHVFGVSNLVKGYSTGLCPKCAGSGQLECEHCHGSGNCPTCHGSGKVTCEKCNGTGWYQTYLGFRTTQYRKVLDFTGSTEISEYLSQAKGNILYDGIYKKWRNATSEEFDKTTEMENTCRTALGTDEYLFDEYKKEYESNTDLTMPSDATDRQLNKSIQVSDIDTVKLTFHVNGEDHVLYVVGNNKVVLYKDLPKVLNEFKVSLWQRIKLAMSEKKRLKAYAKLAAYIFKCDGKSAEESRLFNQIILELGLADTAKAKLIKDIDAMPADMPYEKFRREIKCLFVSPKTLSFAWQCMAVDKQVSPKEENLMSKLAAEYNITDAAELAKFKNIAKKYCLIPDNLIIKDYCDITEEARGLKRKILYVIAGGIMTIAIIATLFII